MTTTTALILAALVLIAVAVVALFVARGSRRQHQHLRERFGPEYDRALEEFGDRTRAERELAARARRVRQYRIHPLEEAERQRYVAAWTQVQARFVDDPSGAVTEADALINRVMQARGYPMEDFEERVADLSVEHPNVVQHYRAAHALALDNRHGRADTEELRQAFVHYRALFADLLEAPAPAQTQWQEARA